MLCLCECWPDPINPQVSDPAEVTNKEQLEVDVSLRLTIATRNEMLKM
jgi:hypothetical protein